MAEYREFHCPYGDDFEGGDECDRCEQYELCMETPTADVIERSRYEQLDKEANALSKAYQEEHEKYKQLRLNVRKDIAEIKELYTEWEYSTNDARLESNPFGAVMNIIQRNTGE